MQIQHILPLLKDWYSTRNRADLNTQRLIRFVRVDIKAQLLSGVKPTDHYVPMATILPAIKNHRRMRAILNTRPPIIIGPDRGLNGLNKLWELAGAHPENISHLDYLTIEKLYLNFACRRHPVYWDEIKDLVPRKSRIYVDKGIFKLKEGFGAVGETETSNSIGTTEISV